MEPLLGKGFTPRACMGDEGSKSTKISASVKSAPMRARALGVERYSLWPRSHESSYKSVVERPN